MTPTATLTDLPPSAKFILWVLDYQGPLTRREIIDETGLDTRTVERSLSQLTDADLIESAANPEDPRGYVYSPTI